MRRCRIRRRRGGAAGAGTARSRPRGRPTAAARRAVSRPAPRPPRASSARASCTYSAILVFCETISSRFCSNCRVDSSSSDRSASALSRVSTRRTSAIDGLRVLDARRCSAGRWPRGSPSARPASRHSGVQHADDAGGPLVARRPEPEARGELGVVRAADQAHRPRVRAPRRGARRASARATFRSRRASRRIGVQYVRHFRCGSMATPTITSRSSADGSTRARTRWPATRSRARCGSPA